ncbi:MAG: hypothetical protein IT581_12280 [Verrucomicrobiales bacterium]|nr:hypothetical protein [Verrucomicrobiales bacterium]
MNSVFTKNSAIGGAAFMRFDLRPGVGFGGGLYLSRGAFNGVHLTCVEVTLGPKDGKQDFVAYALNSLGIEPDTNGFVTCRFAGPISSTGVLETSADFRIWSVAGSITTDAQGWWSTRLAPELATRFFRVRRVNLGKPSSTTT